HLPLVRVPLLTPPRPRLRAPRLRVNRLPRRLHPHPESGRARVAPGRPAPPGPRRRPAVGALPAARQRLDPVLGVDGDPGAPPHGGPGDGGPPVVRGGPARGARRRAPGDRAEPPELPRLRALLLPRVRPARPRGSDPPHRGGDRIRPDPAARAGAHRAPRVLPPPGTGARGSRAHPPGPRAGGAGKDAGVLHRGRAKPLARVPGAKARVTA